jgi:hypothetical protein
VLEAEILLLDAENIIMMIVSCAICYVCPPLELLLGSYAFLGPAHYLTQISWMHDRAYFCGSRLLILILAPLAVLLVLFQNDWEPLLCLALAVAAASVLTRTLRGRVILLAGFAALYFAVLRNISTFGLVIVFLLPTVIHIFVFTLMFIIAGFAKTRALSTLASAIVLVACAASFFIIGASPPVLAPDWVNKNIDMFASIADTLLQLEGYTSETAGRVIHPTMQFIAFAYTYHYLNWFSKTRLIGWNKVSRGRLTAMAASYLVFIVIYLYDYRLGFQALLFLSMLHVILEFPLDLVTARTIGASFAHRRLARA